MKPVFDLFPIIVFFAAFKYFDGSLFYATGAVIIVSVLQLALYWFKYRRFDRILLITAGLAIGMGGIALLFQNETLIKWKPTAMYWAIAILMFASQFIFKKPIIQSALEHELQLPRKIWIRLSLMWIGFFVVMGFVNIYFAYNFPTDVWVNFKVFGGLGLTLLFAVVQTIYLFPYIKADKEAKHNDG